jgi:hypothetical protein
VPGDVVIESASDDAGSTPIIFFTKHAPCPRRSNTRSLPAAKRFFEGFLGPSLGGVVDVRAIVAEELQQHTVEERPVGLRVIEHLLVASLVEQLRRAVRYRVACLQGRPLEARGSMSSAPPMRRAAGS